MMLVEKCKFIKTLQVPCITLTLDKTSQNYLNIIKTIVKPYLLKVPNFFPIQDACMENKDNLTSDVSYYKKIFLNPEKIDSKQTFNVKLNDSLLKTKLKYHFIIEQVQLNYENWTVKEVLDSVLPSGITVSGYSVIGHIIHVNLREEHMPFKYLIGEVLLDKIKNCESVVNKIKIIDNKYRNFTMELLAGNSNTQVCVKECGCIYEFDFAEVYWNPRLSTERTRIMNKLSQDDVVYDVFAGVGPFCIPAAKKKCRVMANDINPDSFRWLNHNVKLNKIKDRVTCFELDGSEFIRFVVAKDLELNVHNNSNYHVIMNLPDSALDFVPNFLGLLDCCIKKAFKILIHLYLFHPKDEYSQVKIIKIVENKLKISIINQIEEIITVRAVSPNKLMVCISFYLYEKELQKNYLEPTEKKIKY